MKNNVQFSYGPSKLFSVGMALSAATFIIGTPLLIISSHENSKNKLEQLADTNNGQISIKEKSKMYEICGVLDKGPTYVITREDIQKGLKAYEAGNQ